MLSSMVNKKSGRWERKLKIYDYLYLHVCAHIHTSMKYTVKNDQTKGIETGWIKERLELFVYF